MNVVGSESVASMKATPVALSGGIGVRSSTYVELTSPLVTSGCGWSSVGPLASKRTREHAG